MIPRLFLGPLLVLSLAAVANADNTSVRHDYPTFGVSFVTPAGAASQLPSEPSHIAIFRSSSANLVVELEPRVDQSLDDYAAVLSKRGGAPVVAGHYTIGGEAAIKIAGPGMDSSFRTVYVVIHDSKGYLFNCVGRDADSNDQLLNPLLPTVRFDVPDAPSQHLDTFFPQSITFLGQISFNGPTSLRPYAQKANSFMIGMHDFVNCTDPFFINIQHISLPGTHRFANIHPSLGPILKDKLNLDDVPVWRPHATISNLFISQFVGGPNPSNPDKRLLTRYAALDLGAGNYIQLIFTVEDNKDLDIQAYKDVTDRMLDTVSTPSNASAAGAP